MTPVPRFARAISRVVLLIPLLALLWTLVDIAHAQTYVRGLPTVGSSTPTAAPSQMSIDATQFFVPNQVDMCGAIKAACAKLGTTGYPLGATIDARGFTGNQVCASGNITTMLFQCAPQGSSTGATGGKLLLGNVNLYADGPASGNYTDGTSVVGTPALIIPSKFWGIEGISRGATPGSGSSPGTGTFLSICTGSGAPVNNCTTAFPKRSFPIVSASVTGNTMTITLTGNVMKYTNIYPAELTMVPA